MDADADPGADLERRLRSGNRRERQQAAHDAARLQDVRRLPQLLCLAQRDDAQDVRRAAAAAVGRFSRRHPQAFAMLPELARHPDPGVAIQAARGLIAARTPEQRAVAEPLLAELAAHPNEVVLDFIQTEQQRAGVKLAPNANLGSKSGGGG